MDTFWAMETALNAKLQTQTVWVATLTNYRFASNALLDIIWVQAPALNAQEIVECVFHKFHVRNVTMDSIWFHWMQVEQETAYLVIPPAILVVVLRLFALLAPQALCFKDQNASQTIRLSYSLLSRRMSITLSSLCRISWTGLLPKPIVAKAQVWQTSLNNKSHCLKQKSMDLQS